jgi:citrate lyase subunit beta/citryl-CoA lyase
VDPRVARTILFVPGSRPDRFRKAAASGADLVVLDLEDAVSPDSKAEARRSVREYLAQAAAAVRINAAGTQWHREDLEKLGAIASAVMVPKAEAGIALTEVGRSLEAMGTPLLALVETAAGILDARAIAATPGVSRLVFGSFDLAAELGVDPLDREALGHARTSLVLASAAAGLAGPVDSVHSQLVDEAGLREETELARRLGFTGKLCIHPAQVSVIEAAMSPRREQLEWARKIIEASESGGAVLAVDGAMVDKPVIDRARRMLQAGR